MSSTHAIAGLDYEMVLSRAKARGWSAEKGMKGISAWFLMRDLGIRASQFRFTEGRVTLAAFLKQIDHVKCYILVTNEHWIAVRFGQVLDKARTNGRALVHGYMVVET